LSAPDPLSLTDGPSDVERAVREILSDLRARGDAALRELTLRFDRVDRASPRLTPREIAEAVGTLSDETRQTLEAAHQRIAAFARAQREALRAVDIELGEGVRVGHRFLPVASAGCYVPGGRYPLPSTALMTIVPARVAGVPRIVACSPPGPDGVVHPLTVAAMILAGAQEIYCMGGVQAIGALAYGTETVPPVDVIVGPGNRYVVEAKRQVFGRVGIDLLAGPTEVCIIADHTADPATVAADLLAQAEHDVDAIAVLLTTDATVAEAVRRQVEDGLRRLPTAEVARTSWTRHGEVIVVGNLEEACTRANALAPEHLELHVVDPEPLIPRLTAYGTLFIGPFAGAVFGDYAAGPTHVLPTGRTARFSEGLWVGHFLRAAPFIRLSAAGAGRLAPVAMRFAELEGLPAHRDAARKRLLSS